MEIVNHELTSEMHKGSEINNGDARVDECKESLTAAEIQTWLVSYLAELLEINPNEVETTIPFDRYGLDSSAVVGLTGDMEDFLGCNIDPTIMYDYSTVKALAQHLAEELKVKA